MRRVRDVAARREKGRVRESGGNRRLGRRASRFQELRTRRIVGRIFRKSKLGDDFSADEVLLNDTLENLGRAGVIPDAVRINDGDRALLTNAQAVGFGAVDGRIAASSQAEFFKALFEVFPRREPGLFCAALWLGLIGAEEDVALDFAETECVRAGL